MPVLIKFTSEGDISSEFPSVWDGKEIGDINDERHQIPASFVMEGNKVYIKYSLVSYVTKKGKDEEQGYLSDCTLKLHSIELLKEWKIISSSHVANDGL